MEKVHISCLIQIDSVGVMYAHKVVDSALVKLTQD